MAKSEIDDIFASVGGESSKDKSKKSKTGKTSKIESTKPNDEKKNANVSDIQPKAKTKRKAPETVVDPSKALESAASTSAKKQKKGKSTSKDGVSAEDEEFRDSRGINRRKTDDGFAIYSEKELKLDQGGDTELCPFDCDCCF